MIIVALLALLPATAGFDVDDVGLSALERSAIVERARAELGGGAELVDAPGLAECAADSPEASAPAEDDAHPHRDCARDAIAGVGATAGAAVRVVKVLQVVRVELTILDRDGAIVATSLRTLDVEGAAKGPLFDGAARDALANLAPKRTGDRDNERGGDRDGDRDGGARKRNVDVPPLERQGPLPVAAVGAGIAGALIAIVGGAFATNEALLANNPASSGDEKERARVLGPVATVVTVVGVALAVGAPMAIVMLE